MKTLKIHPLFIVVLLLSVLAGQFKRMLIFFTIILFHELGHYLAALIFSWRIISIDILPFGGIVTFEEHSNKPLFQELIVLIMGPLFQLIYVVFFYLLYRFGFLMTSTYNYIYNINILLLMFNLLPIWPLDGGKILFVIESGFIPYKLAHKTMLFLSFFALLMFSLYTLTSKLNYNVVIILVFVGYSLFIEYQNHEYVFNRFLLSRYLEKPYFKRTKIHKSKGVLAKTIKRFYRNYNNVIKVNHSFISEDEVLNRVFTKKKLTK